MCSLCGWRRGSAACRNQQLRGRPAKGSRQRRAGESGGTRRVLGSAFLLAHLRAIGGEVPESSSSRAGAWVHRGSAASRGEPRSETCSRGGRVVSGYQEGARKRPGASHDRWMGGEMPDSVVSARTWTWAYGAGRGWRRRTAKGGRHQRGRVVGGYQEGARGVAGRFHTSLVGRCGA